MTRTSAVRTRPLPRRLALGTLAALALVLAPACGGDDGGEEASDATEETVAADASTGDDSSDSGATDTGGDTAPADDGQPDVDVCEAVTAEDISEALDGAEIVDAVRRDVAVVPAPNCDYLVAYDGVELPAVTVTAYEDGFFEGQRDANPSATPLEGLDDAVVIDDIGYTAVVAGASADYSITRGVELTSGGEPPTDEQMLAVVTLFQQA